MKSVDRNKKRPDVPKERNNDIHARLNIWAVPAQGSTRRSAVETSAAVLCDTFRPSVFESVAPARSKHSCPPFSLKLLLHTRFVDDSAVCGLLLLLPSTFTPIVTNNCIQTRAQLK